MTKTKKKAAAKGTKSETASSGRDPATGRLLKGHGMPGPGRPALPGWLKQAAPKSLQLLRDTAEGKNEDATPELVMRAQERITELYYGKPGKTRSGNALPVTDADRTKMAEEIVLLAADAGDAESARAYLAAKMPEVWGKLVAEPKDATKSDTLRWVPVLGAAPGKGQVPS